MDTLSTRQPESPSLEAPKWLDVLENRKKRPHRLAHEIGAGSPCLLCKEKCKGLNLHFWRKICTECKCRKEDHDFVDDEEYVQFEILFGAKRVKKTTVQYNAHMKTFDWVPQNAPQDLIVDYLNALPESKLPITNSEGAIHRKQQLEKQVPVHDVNPNVCHNLTDKEVSEFGKYLDNLRNNVIGQGKIMKFQQCTFLTDTYRPCSSTSDAVGRSDVQMTGPYCVGIRGHVVRGGDHEVNTVYSEKVNGQSYRSESASKIDYMNHNKSDTGDVTPNTHRLVPNVGPPSRENPNYPNIAGKMQDLNIGPRPFKPLPSQYNPPLEETLKTVSDVPRAELRTPSSFVKGQQPVYDSQNNYAGMQLNNNDIPQQNRVREGRDRLSELISNNRNNQLLSGKNSAAVKIEPFNVNIMNITSSDLPFTPLQESQNIPPARVSGKDYVQPQDEFFVDSSRVPNTNQDQKCLQCKTIFTPNDVVVAADRGGDSALWHARCFICHICEELLVDLMYFYHEGKVYCGRDYAKVRNIPRCFACDELIFVKEYTQAEGDTYHVKHFCCFHCDEPLAGKQYVSKENHPVCLDCYQTYYGKACSTCLKLIPVAEQRISFGDFHFHVNPNCFRCENCHKFLKGQRFVMKNGKPFCSRECFQQFLV